MSKLLWTTAIGALVGYFLLGWPNMFWVAFAAWLIGNLQWQLDDTWYFVQKQNAHIERLEAALYDLKEENDRRLAA